MNISEYALKSISAINLKTKNMSSAKNIKRKEIKIPDFLGKRMSARFDAISRLNEPITLHSAEQFDPHLFVDDYSFFKDISKHSQLLTAIDIP